MTESQANLLDWGTTTKGVRCHVTILQGDHYIAEITGKITKMDQGLGWLVKGVSGTCCILTCNNVAVVLQGGKKLFVGLRLSGRLLTAANTRAHAALYDARRQQYEKDMEATYDTP